MVVGCGLLAVGCWLRGALELSGVLGMAWDIIWMPCSDGR